MAKRGRPTKYKPEYVEEAYELCLLGYTDQDLAAHFGVNQDTLYEWKKNYPDFSESIQAGKAPADAKVVRALYNRAIGYSHDAVKIFVIDGKTVEHKYIEHYPPDYNSMRLWLMNRQPQRWRDKQVIDTGAETAGKLHEIMEQMKNQPHVELPIDASE